MFKLIILVAMYIMLKVGQAMVSAKNGVVRATHATTAYTSSKVEKATSSLEERIQSLKDEKNKQGTVINMVKEA
jgi:hypothetical protein